MTPMIKRREFLAGRRRGAGGWLRPFAARPVPARKTGKVETVFRSPGPKPNGLQATREGLWIIDQGDNRAYLVSYNDGKVLRRLDTEADKASGITFNGDAIWIASTYSREIVQSQAMTGKTMVKYFTPGAGVIYRMVGDPPNRTSPLVSRLPARSVRNRPRIRGSASGQGQKRWGFPAGTGVGQPSARNRRARSGVEGRKTVVAVPPSRTIYRINPEDWVVELKFPTVGNRPHGIGWEGQWLWCTTSNLNAFFKHNPETGEVAREDPTGRQRSPAARHDDLAGKCGIAMTSVLFAG